MKKIHLYILFFISPFLSFAQVGINTQTPNLSAMLHVDSSSKGVSIPNVYLQSLRDNTTIPNPKESLLVFNTNENLIPGQGLYYWSGDRWVVIFSEKSQDLFENLLKFYAEKDDNGYDFDANTFYGENVVESTIGTSLIGSTQWTILNGLTSNIVIDRAENDELYIISGMIQANNNNRGNSNSLNSTYVSSSIGVFVDNKLIAIRPLIMDFTNKCTYTEFTMSFFSKNLAVGNHEVKFAVRNRNRANNDIVLSFGKRNSSSACNNILSNDETRLSSNIFINQPFEF